MPEAEPGIGLCIAGCLQTGGGAGRRHPLSDHCAMPASPARLALENYRSTSPDYICHAPVGIIEHGCMSRISCSVATVQKIAAAGKGLTFLYFERVP